jgi:hypothetical protein
MNAEATVPEQKHRRFEDHLPREGFAEPELTSDRFRAIPKDAMPGGEWPDAVIVPRPSGGPRGPWPAALS